MKNIQISLQKVVSILRRQFIKDKSDPIQIAMYRTIFRDFKAGYLHEILLVTGAKIVKDGNDYWLCGYHYNGDDVDHYFKKKEVKIK